MNNTNPLSVNPKPKRRKQDRFSELPDPIILHIFSFLPINDALRSSVLSKRFQWLWISLTTLNFEDIQESELNYSFVNFVNETLIAIESPRIEQFKIKFCFSNEFTTTVHRWIEFATLKKVKSLEIDLSLAGLPTRSYRLSKKFHINSDLTELRVTHCKFVSKCQINWPSLKFLEICFCDLSNSLLKNILLGCPVLETLNLRFWRGINRLEINSSSLRNLVLFEEWESGLYGGLRISAPNLQTLDVSGRLWGELRLRNLTSLVSATINLKMAEISRNKKKSYQNMLWEILENLCHVKNLSLGDWCIQVLSAYAFEDISFPPLNYQSLTLLDRDFLSWKCLALFLHASPYMESLIIKLPYTFARQFLGQNFSAPQETKYGCHHLKLVKIIDVPESIEEFPHVLHLLELLLANGPVLEKVIIRRQKYVSSNSSISCYPLEQKLLQQMPRASPHVVFSF